MRAATVSRPAALFKRRWTPETAAKAIREMGPLVAYGDLHDLTLWLSGTDRMNLFDSLPPATQEAMRASLRTKLERERS